jgi:hypothetical protein
MPIYNTIHFIGFKVQQYGLYVIEINNYVTEGYVQNNYVE